MNYVGLLVFISFVLRIGTPVDAQTGVHMRGQLLDWARSNEKSDPPRVHKALTDPATLQAVERDFAPSGRRGVRQATPYDEIFGALASNSTPSAHEAFARLASDPKFATVASESPLDPLSALVRASASLPNPDSRIVDLWRRLSVPQAGYAPLVFETLLANGAPAAIELSVALLASKKHPADERIAWIRSSLTPRRTSEAALAAAERMLASSAVPRQVKTTVVEALFARDVASWFTPGRWPGPLPDPTTASAAALESRSRIARRVLASDIALPGPLRNVIEAAAR
jgi:hypothetical protein